MIVIPSRPDEAYDATTIAPADALVGNTTGVVAPQRSAQIDVDADGTNDLVLYYSVEETNGLGINAKQPTGNNRGHESVGLHYRDEDGTGRLISDIFGLGAPVKLPRDNDDEEQRLRTYSL